jgi:hypothetical protein
VSIARLLTAGTATALVCAVAGAQEIQPPTALDLTGARGIGMSAALGAAPGVAPGNDGIFTNAAGLLTRQRYSVEAQYMLDRTGGETDGQLVGTSVVDSQPEGVTGGVAYTRFLSGPFTGSGYHLALATPLMQGLFVGATGKYLSLDGPGEKVRVFTADASLFWQVIPLVSIGAAGYNLIPVGHRSQIPQGVGVGVGAGSDTSIQVAADWRGYFQTDGKLKNVYAAGAEYAIANMVPVRAGYLRDDRRGGQFWSAGLGFITPDGVALDVSYRQAFGGENNRTFSVGIRKYFFNAQ